MKSMEEGVQETSESEGQAGISAQRQANHVSNILVR